jgi:hypothetical protein
MIISATYATSQGGIATNAKVVITTNARGATECDVGGRNKCRM